MNYNFESQIENFSAEVREFYEKLVPIHLRNIEKQFQKQGEIRLLRKDGDISGIAVMFPYDTHTIHRIKNLCYRHDTKPAWNPDKKWWKMPKEMLGEIAFAFPNLEISSKIVDLFPNTLEIQECGFQCFCFLQARISEKGAISVLSQKAFYKDVEPEAKAIAFKMGFDYECWSE